MTGQQTHLAVLFADITGSKRLFETVGDAIARSIEHEWFAQVRALLPQFAGRLVKTIGDEVMCVFPSADQGVLAASAIQAAVAAEPPAGYEITLHVGLHWGSVIVESADVYGDTVNVAAYLAAVAAPEQIMTTEATHAALSDSLQGVVRPVFRASLRGSPGDAIVHEVLWKTDHAELTDSFFSARTQQLGAPDVGGLLLKYRGQELRIDHQNASAVLGRHSSCDLVIHDLSASRRHARIELQGMDFYLIDQSINGTFVIADGHPEVEVLRRDLRLSGSGRIYLARSVSQQPAEAVAYSRDRRSLFRP